VTSVTNLLQGFVSYSSKESMLESLDSFGLRLSSGFPLLLLLA
jgi:hypothetical protein